MTPERLAMVWRAGGRQGPAGQGQGDPGDFRRQPDQAVSTAARVTTDSFSRDPGSRCEFGNGGANSPVQRGPDGPYRPGPIPPPPGRG